MIAAVFVDIMGAKFSLNLAPYTPPTLLGFFTDFQWNMLEYVWIKTWNLWETKITLLVQKG